MKNQVYEFETNFDTGRAVCVLISQTTLADGSTVIIYFTPVGPRCHINRAKDSKDVSLTEDDGTVVYAGLESV